MVLEVMKKTAKDLKIKLAKDDGEKEIKIKLLEYWIENGIELDCECPKCGNEIPDVNSCPFCGVNFSSDEEEKKDDEKKEESSEVKEEVKEKEKEEDEVSEEEMDEILSKGKTKESKSKISSSKKEKLESKKKEEKEEPKKKEKVNKERKEKKRSTMMLRGTFKYEDAVKEIDSELGDKLVKKENSVYTSYFHGSIRIIAVMRSTRSYTLEIPFENFPWENKEEWRKYSKEEIINGRKGTIAGVLKVKDLKEVVHATKLSHKLAIEIENSKKKDNKEKKEKKDK